jgi:anti-sigma regulatory factor (Ser/Thr protein kinase)
MNTAIAVEESSQVAQARRAAVALAQRIAIDADTIDRLALAVTEAATNLVKHAKRGQILLAPLSLGGAVGIEVIAVDHGPGIRNVASSMRDGHSTAGSPGLGLGSLSRLASNFEIHSRPGSGSVVRFEMWKHASVPPARSITHGGVCVAKTGETACGDAWSAHECNGVHRLLVVDGLGHGPDAARAAQAAIRVAHDHPRLAPVELLERVHGALRSTRGAAAAVASVEAHAARGTFAGLGNIRAFTYTSDGARNLVSHNGTLGYQARKFQSFEFAFPPRALLVLHSDGIDSHVNLASYPGLDGHHPTVVAAVIYRDHLRGRDDASVAVLRHANLR